MRDDLNVELIGSYLDAELTVEEQAEAERLLSDSDVYQQLYEDLYNLRSALQVLPRYRLADDFADRVLQQITSRPSLVEPSVSRTGKAGRSWQGLWPRLAVLAAGLAALVLLTLLPQWSGPEDSGVAKRETENVGTIGGKTAQDGTQPAGDRSPVATESRIADLHELVVARAGDDGAARAEYLFVVDVSISASGQQRNVFVNALVGAGIAVESTIEVNPNLENALLGSRFLENVEPKREAPREEGNVQLLYVMGTGEQIDLVVADLRSRMPNIASVRFDLAMQPSDVQLFEELQRAANTGLAVVEPAQPGAAAEQQPVSRGHWLAIPFALLSTSTHSMLSYVPATDDQPMPPDAAARTTTPPAPRQPFAPAAQGPPVIYKVLFILRELP